MTDQNVAVVEPKVDEKPKSKKLPPYNVILLDDDFHTVTYVVTMMQKIFGKTKEDGVQVARNVHHQGRAICLTTTKEHAELKRDQIHSFGVDPLAMNCQGSMSAVIEPVEG